MTDTDTQKKLDRLAKIEEGNRARSLKYLKKIKAEGKKQVTAILNPEAYQELTRRRDESVRAGNPLSFGGIIEAALLQDAKPGIDVATTEKKNIKSNVNIDVSANTIKKDEIPDCHGKEPTQDERDDILIKVGEQYPGRKHSQKLADVLNDASVPIKDAKGEWIRGQWDAKKATDNIGTAKKRLKNK